jgi:hypothetical protein
MGKTVSIPLKINSSVRLEILSQPAGLLLHNPSHCSSTVRILVKKASFWSNNHSCPNQTRNSAQVEGDPKVPFSRSIMVVGGGESLLLCQSYVLFHLNKIWNNNGRWHKLDIPSWSELSHAVDLVGSSLNYSSSWPWLENHFLCEVIFMPQHQYVRGLLDLAQKIYGW